MPILTQAAGAFELKIKGSTLDIVGYFMIVVPDITLAIESTIINYYAPNTQLSENIKFVGSKIHNCYSNPPLIIFSGSSNVNGDWVFNTTEVGPPTILFDTSLNLNGNLDNTNGVIILYISNLFLGIQDPFINANIINSNLDVMVDSNIANNSLKIVNPSGTIQMNGDFRSIATNGSVISLDFGGINF